MRRRRNRMVGIKEGRISVAKPPQLQCCQMDTLRTVQNSTHGELGACAAIPSAAIWKPYLRAVVDVEYWHLAI